MSRKEFRELADPATAHAVIDDLEIDPGSETVPLDAATDRILADRIDAAIDVPGFDRSTMDGYAVRARDTAGADEAEPVTLDLRGTVHAGEAPSDPVEPGTTVEISTGAVLPPGADAVVKVERTTMTDGRIEVRSPVAPGDNVMLAGADIAAGARALGPGTRITAREIGLLSALGIADVPVRGTPTVGIVSTGNELVRPGNPIDTDVGEIYDVNSYTLASAIDDTGGDPVVYPHAGDDYEEMEQLLHRAAAECDLVLSSGSTSAGAVDVIHRVIEERGELLLHGVAVKPGKPMLIGRIGEAAYIGLPGYPVSALTIFRTFVAPAIRTAAGLDPSPAETVEGRMGVREYYSEGRLRFMPVGLVADADGDLIVYPTDKGSGATTSLVEADGFVEVPAAREQLDVRDRVTVRLFSPSVRPPAMLGVGEDDPVLSRLLDRIDRPRYLPVGTSEGLRRLRDGVPDIAVAAGPTHREIDATELGEWDREWGFIVPRGNPDHVDGITDLVDRDLQFVNRDPGSGLRRSLTERMTDLADARDTPVGDLEAAIRGFDLTVKAHESPARKVDRGLADVGLGLAVTAAQLGLGFVSLGHQPVRVLARPDRTAKTGVQQFATALDDVASITADLAGCSV